MPVDVVHSEYLQNIQIWRKIRAAIAGEDEIKKSNIFLPRLSGMSEDDYNQYKNRAKFYAAPERTLSAFVGFVRRKPSTIIIDDDQIQYLIDDVDAMGTSLEEFAGNALKEVLAIGRLGLSVDIAPNGRIVLAQHTAESIINWQADSFSTPSLVVAKESELIPSDDPYVSNSRDVYRSWRIVNGAAIYERYHIESGSAEPVNDLTTELSSPTGRLDTIPFVIVGTLGRSVNVGKSIMAPIVNLALHHYLISADRNWALHFTALPTPYILGVQPSQAPSSLGPTSMWVIPNEMAKVGMLEFTGAGLREMAQEMEDTKREIADMGARILESRARSAEAADTVSMKSQSDSANLNAVCSAVSDAITRALQIGARWIGRPNPDTISFSFNRDFLPTRMSPTELTALINAWMQSAISDQELYAALQEGEIVDSGKDYEQHSAEIEETKSSRGGVPIFESGVGRNRILP